MARRNRPTTIDRMPKEVREKVARLRQEGRTIDEIVAVLETLVPEADMPSRSSVGRHVEKLKRVGERMRESQQLAEALSKNFGDKQTSDLTRASLELLQDIILRTLTESDDAGDGPKFDPKDIMFLATGLEKAAKAGKTDFDQQLATAREIERRATAQKAADNAVSEAKKRGLSAETVHAIKAAILGVE